MEQEGKNDECQWKRGVKEPFQGDKDKFASIPKSNRSEFTKQMLKKEQIKGIPPYKYQIPFPSESTFKYLDYDLNYYQLVNTPKPKAILIIVHGLNSSGHVFGYFASKIAEKNKDVNVYSFDQMNFGKSNGGLRGLVVSLEDSVRQVEIFIEVVLAKLQVKPKVFICGMSYGGTISFKLTLKNPQNYAGVIFLAPALRDIQQSYYYGKKLMCYVGWLMPRLQLSQRLPPSAGTKYDISERLRADPLVFTDYIIPGAIRSIMNAQSQISKLYSSFTSPFLCIAAGVEKVVDPFAALDLEEQSPSKDKTVLYAQSMWHALMYEEEIVGVSWHCAEWLRERI